MADAVSRKDLRLRAEVLEETADTFQRLPYSALLKFVYRPYTRVVAGRDGKKHQLRVRVQRRQPGSKDVEVAWLAPATAGAQSAIISGIVRGTDGEPIGGARVMAQTAPSDQADRTTETTTNDSGRFGFIGLRAGR